MIDNTQFGMLVLAVLGITLGGFIVLIIKIIIDLIRKQEDYNGVENKNRNT